MLLTQHVFLSVRQVHVRRRRPVAAPADLDARVVYVERVPARLGPEELRQAFARASGCRVEHVPSRASGTDLLRIATPSVRS